MCVVLSKIGCGHGGKTQEVSPAKWRRTTDEAHDNVTRVFTQEAPEGLEVFDNISFHVRLQRECRLGCEVDAQVNMRDHCAGAFFGGRCSSFCTKGCTHSHVVPPISCP